MHLIHIDQNWYMVVLSIARNVRDQHLGMNSLLPNCVRNGSPISKRCNVGSPQYTAGSHLTLEQQIADVRGTDPLLIVI